MNNKQQEYGREGGLKRAQQFRQEYNANPNTCLTCGKIILVEEGVRVSITKKKKFCNSSCSAKYNNSQRNQKTLEYYNNPNRCLHCKSVILISEGRSPAEARRKKFCNSQCSAQYHGENKATLHLITKGELFSSCLNWQSARSTIAKHARAVYIRNGKQLVCSQCGYDKHADVAHIRPVSDFPDTATIAEINHIDNLTALCPNHHWEYDNGLPETLTN